MTAGWRRCCFQAVAGRPNQLTRSSPDFAEVHRQLQTHKHVTLQLVWEEYRETQPDGYSYSRFCELYQRWSRNQDVVLRQEHRAGEKMFVDWLVTPFPSTTRETARSHRPHYSSPFSGPARTPLREPQGARI